MKKAFVTLAIVLGLIVSMPPINTGVGAITPASHGIF
jgi:hypothetical protein